MGTVCDRCGKPGGTMTILRMTLFAETYQCADLCRKCWKALKGWLKPSKTEGRSGP